MKKRILYIFVSLIILGLIIDLAFNINKFKNVKDISWEEFKPFSNSKYIKNIQIDLKIKENQPTIEAASAFYPLASGIVQNTFDKNSYKDEFLKMVSTNEAYEDLSEGKTDIIIATGPSKSQKELLEKSKKKINKIILYKEPLVIYVNNKNQINNISLDDIKRIYKENNINWNNFSETSGNIITYQLEENNGSQTCMQNVIGNNIINKCHKEIKTMPSIINKVGNNRNGIGYAFEQYYTRMHINKNTKKIKVNNFDSSNEEYPLLFEVYLFYNEDSINTYELVNFLNSNSGKELVKKLL